VALQNRVTPFGELLADPARGLVCGNRGCLHNARGEIRRHHATVRWIACRLEFRGWRRTPLMQPGKFTELFFLDEATAFAAGHRPCALCRREDYNRFVALWRRMHRSDNGADAIDARLHRERFDKRTGGQRHHRAELADLPDGTFVLRAAIPALVLGDELLRWTPSGYDDRERRRPGESAVVITPPSLVAVLRAGWDGAVPLFHPSAGAQPAASQRA
jgi:hypothetical protein